MFLVKKGTNIAAVPVNVIIGGVPAKIIKSIVDDK